MILLQILKVKWIILEYKSRIKYICPSMIQAMLITLIPFRLSIPLGVPFIFNKSRELDINEKDLSSSSFDSVERYIV